MKWRGLVLAAGAAALMAQGAAASELSEAAKAALPPMFVLHELPGTQSLSFQGRTLPYTAAQLTANMRRQDMFLSGYVFFGEVPEADRALVAPYFQYNLTEEELSGLAAVNSAFFDTEAPLHKAVEESLSRWADQMMGGSGAARLQVALEDMEPIRKVSHTEALLYTAGARVTLSSDGFIMPLYGRAYMYPDGSSYRVVMLITSDDSRQPMAYAIEDLARDAAQKAARRNLARFVQNLKNGRAGGQTDQKQGASPSGGI